eukprot:1009845-Pyramimonas_sp.AAC.1
MFSIISSVKNNFVGCWAGLSARRRLRFFLSREGSAEGTAATRAGGGKVEDAHIRFSLTSGGWRGPGGKQE